MNERGLRNSEWVMNLISKLIRIRIIKLRQQNVSTGSMPRNLNGGDRSSGTIEF